MKLFSRTARPGFGLVETIVGAAIISILLIGLAEVGRITFRVVDESNFRSRAVFLAEEGIEAAKTVRDSGWTANIASLLLDTDYYFTFSGTNWQLGQVHGPLVDDVFTRVVRFSPVCRDSSDDIAVCGNPPFPDADVRTVSVSVGWVNRGQAATTTISTYLTNLFAN